MTMRLVSSYHSSHTKRVFDLVASLTLLVFLSPLIFAISCALKFINHGSVFFIQKRVGKGGSVFKLIKFRTMITGAEKLRSKYKHLNISDGPAFKIPNDPRYTKVGKYLAKTGLDEIPQLFNVLKGEMSLVGPRPLPIYEADKLSKIQKVRESIRPGITSSWITRGAHAMKFSEWMRLDAEYVKNAHLFTDLAILISTFILIGKLIYKNATRRYLVKSFNFFFRH